MINLYTSWFLNLKGVIILLTVNVDEFTLVLQTTKRPRYIEEWGYMANKIIEGFIRLSQVEIILGELEETNTSLPMGYSQGFVCKDVPYYFAIAYHADHIQMGICIKFSAYAWNVYRANYQSLYTKSTEIHQFLSSIQNENLYSSRLSRIDIAIDFINENVNVNTIYNQLSKKNQHLKTATGRKNNSNLSAITKNNITSTFYLGSKGKNIKALLRVYDKKLEQIETLGFQYQDAITFENWIRFEASYRGAYAHSISLDLEFVNNDKQLKDLLVSAFTDRYQFYYTKSNRLTTYSKKMLDLLYQKT